MTLILVSQLQWRNWGTFIIQATLLGSGCQNQTSVHAVKPHCCAEILHKSLRVLLHPSAELEPDLHRKSSFIFFFFFLSMALLKESNVHNQAFLPKTLHLILHFIFKLLSAVFHRAAPKTQGNCFI